MRQESPPYNNQYFQLKLIKNQLNPINPNPITNLNKILNKNIISNDVQNQKFKDDELENKGN